MPDSRLYEPGDQSWFNCLSPLNYCQLSKSLN